MKLYHGTNEDVAKLAETQGLLPRFLSENNGNWDHSCPSRVDLVYLTTAYAPYFALASTPVKETFTKRWAIIEIETDHLNEEDLLPDEDFLAQAFNFQTPEEEDPFWDEYIEADTMEERTEFFRERLECFQPHWEDSLSGLGNCAYHGAIPPKAITRIALFDPQSNSFIAMKAADPMISLFNYKICGDQYRALTAWFFGEAKTDDVLGFTAFAYPPEQIANLEATLKETEGLEIASL